MKLPFATAVLLCLPTVAFAVEDAAPGLVPLYGNQKAMTGAHGELYNGLGVFRGHSDPSPGGTNVCNPDEPRPMKCDEGPYWAYIESHAAAWHAAGAAKADAVSEARLVEGIYGQCDPFAHIATDSYMQADFVNPTPFEQRATSDVVTEASVDFLVCELEEDDYDDEEDIEQVVGIMEISVVGEATGGMRPQGGLQPGTYIEMKVANSEVTAFYMSGYWVIFGSMQSGDTVVPIFQIQDQNEAGGFHAFFHFDFFTTEGHSFGCTSKTVGYVTMDSEHGNDNTNWTLQTNIYLAAVHVDD